MSRSSNRSLGVGHSPDIKSNGLRSSWPSPRGSRSEHWPSAPNAIRRLSGGSAVAMRTRACPISWNHPNGPGDRPGFPPCNVHRSFNWPAWSQSPRACTSPTGRARIWPAKRSKMGSSRPSAIGRSKRSSIRWTSSRIARGIGGRLASTLTSRSVPRRSSGATPTPSGWPGGASGWSVPMRNPTSKSWNDIPSGIRSPARSRSVSSITRGTARSTSCSS